MASDRPTAREILDAIAEQMNEHSGLTVRCLQKHPDDDPMIAAYDLEEGDWVLACVTSYADRAHGGGDQAAEWLLEFIKALAEAYQSLSGLWWRRR